MPSITKTNGFLNNFVTGTVFQNANLGFYVATIRSTSNGSNTAVDLRDADGDGAGEADCLLYTSPSPRDKRQSRMPSSA